ncbi:MAG: hypothetical protein H0V10_00225 [Geodermatophilaceae bacterium]|nr:hypothetical protein [Geodermatophilaceae bacterium]
MEISLSAGVPILRMFDVAAATRFHADDLGCTIDWEGAEGDRLTGPASNRVRFYERPRTG